MGAYRHRINTEIALTHIVSRTRQAVIAALGVTFGSAVFIFMNSLMTGFNRHATESLFKTVPHIRIYRDDELSRPLMALLPDSSLPLIVNPRITAHPRNLTDPYSIMSAVKKHPEVTGVTPQVSVNVFYRNGEALVTGISSGVDVIAENTMFDVNSNLTDGRIEDLLEEKDGIILGYEIAQKLNVNMHDNLTVTSASGVSRTMKVMGLFRSGVSQTDRSKSYMNLQTAQQFLRQGPSYVTDICVSLRDYNQAMRYAGELSRISGFKAEDWETANVDATATNKVRRIMALAISMSILLVAAFGIYNIQNMTVMQKMNDIAILKAMGFSGRDVIRIFVTQSILIGMIGVAMGQVLAFVAVNRMSHLYVGGSLGYFPIRLEPMFFGLGAWMGIVFTFLAGYIPARKAAGIDPVEILRK